MKWRRLLDNRTYCDAEQRFVIEFMSGRYWLATARTEGGKVVRAAPIGNYRSCREARRAAEEHGWQR